MREQKFGQQIYLGEYRNDIRKLINKAEVLRHLNSQLCVHELKDLQK